MVLEIKKNINAKKYFPNSKHIIIYAFSVGAKHYFRYDDHLNVPYERALSCLVYYKEIEMNADHAFLQAHVDATNNLLLKNPINIFEIKKLNDLLRQRLKLPKDTELMYKLASVVFFDQDENPQVYEWAYSAKKIEFWKKNTDMSAFFLQKPLQELIPYLQFAGKNLQEYSRLTDRLNEQHLDSLQSHLSDEQRMTLNGKKNISPAATPQN
jgi:hypothetical protein